MANTARLKGALAVAQAALRDRKLDCTLTTALPLTRSGDGHTAGTNVALLDEGLGGGLPRGQLSEIAGPQSSGRMTLLLQMMAAATRRGEITALVDPFDRLDVASVVAADVSLDRFLWIRGASLSPRPTAPLPPSTILDRTIERALKALNLVLQAGGFGVVAIDLADAPLSALRAIPFTTWLRVQRAVEGSDTACLILGAQPLARSARGVTLQLSGNSTWAGESDRSRRLAGLSTTVRIVSARRADQRAITVDARA